MCAISNSTAPQAPPESGHTDFSHGLLKLCIESGRLTLQRLTSMSTSDRPDPKTLRRKWRRHLSNIGSTHPIQRHQPRTTSSSLAAKSWAISRRRRKQKTRRAATAIDPFMSRAFAIYRIMISLLTGESIHADGLKICHAPTPRQVSGKALMRWASAPKAFTAWYFRSAMKERHYGRLF